MKKQATLFITFLFALSVSAQKDDKMLLGTWKFYYFSVPSFTLNTSDMKQTTEQRIKTAIALSPNHLLSSEDSLATVKEMNYKASQLDSSYIKFNKNGTVAFQLFMSLDGETESKKQTGTYTWVDSNHFRVKTDKEQILFSVKSLNAKDLSVVMNEDKEVTDRVTIKFKK